MSEATVNLNSTDMTTENYDHEGLKIIAHLAWGNVLATVKNENRIAMMVRALSSCWLSDDVIRVLLTYGLDPQDFGYEVDPAQHQPVGRCSE